MQLTEAQKEAIEVRGNSVVSSSAGGGKTQVLILRLLRLILVEKVSLENILALTFTEAAASNMRKRLQAKLNEEINKTQKLEEKQYLLSQLALLPQAKISTIHSFCLNVIKEFGYVINLPMSIGNNTLDSEKSAYLLDNAFTLLVAKQPQEIETLQLSLSTALFGYQEVKELLYNCLKKIGQVSEPLIWCDKQLASLKTCNRFDEIPLSYRQSYFNLLNKYYKRIQKQIGEIKTKYNEQLPTKYQTILTNFSAIDIPLAWQEADEFTLLKFIESLKQYTPFPRKNKNESGLEYFFKEIDNLYKYTWPALMKKLKTPAVILKEYNDFIPFNRLALTLSKNLYILYQSLKEKEVCLDFDDYEHYTYKILLANNEEVLTKLKKRYHSIMVDEFQDTSLSQFNILNLLSNNNLFVVGDPKQSIYRFRNAKPSIMFSLMNEKALGFKTINMQDNFRSQEKIVAFNNTLFSQIITDFKAFDYQKAHLESLNNVIFLKPTINNLNAKSRKKEIAKILINKLYHLKEENVAYKDIAILVRSNAEVDYYSNELLKANLPCVGEKNKSYYLSKGMKGLLAYLSLILKEEEAYNKACVLANFYQYSDEDLLLKKPCKELEKDLNKLRCLAQREAFLDLFIYLCNINDYYHHQKNQDQLNIALFIEKLSNLKYLTLSEMLHTILMVGERSETSASDIFADSPIIKVMTIHQAKGLEFKHCFVVLNDEKRKTLAHQLLFDLEMGIAFTYLNKDHKKCEPLNSYALLAKEEEEENKEAMRILYVAFTRAKECLWLVDVNDEKEDYLNISKAQLHQKGNTSLVLYHMQNANNLIIDTSKVTEITSLAKQEEENEDSALLKKIKNYHYEEEKQNTTSSNASSLERRRKLSFTSQEGMSYGTHIHKLFEQIDYQASEPLHNLKDINLKEREILNAFLDNQLIKDNREGKFYQEYPYFYLKNDILNRGYIDLFIENGNNIILIDYKTDIDVDEKHLIEIYLPQQQAYVDILKIKYPNAKIAAYLYLTSEAKFLKLPL